MILRVIAEFAGYRVEQDANGTISMKNGSGLHIGDSAIELIRTVPDLSIRAELVKQWEADQGKQRYAEKQNREGNHERA